MVLNYSQPWDYYLIPVCVFPAKYVPDPLKQNLVFARGT